MSSENTPKFPEATFEHLVQMLSTQAMIALGVIPHPGTNKPEVQLPLARHMIDLLGLVETKTAGNLTPAETAFLAGYLHSLRMGYVEATKKEEAAQATSKNEPATQPK
jgi:Domain of unknown function (DUF1844)